MAAQRDRTVVNLNDRRNPAQSTPSDITAPDAGLIEITCANPRCDQRFRPTRNAGRPQRYHSPECRRAALRDKQQLSNELALLEEQAAQRRAQLVAYGVDDDSSDAGENTAAAVPGPERTAAHDAVAGLPIMVARLLRGDDNSAVVQDLLDLYATVEPVLRPRD